MSIEIFFNGETITCDKMDVLSIEWKGFGEALAGDLWQFYNSNEHSDVTICTDDGHEIKSHRILLAICSKYFRELFKRFKTPNQIGKYKTHCNDRLCLEPSTIVITTKAMVLTICFTFIGKNAFIPKMFNQILST